MQLYRVTPSDVSCVSVDGMMIPIADGMFEHEGLPTAAINALAEHGVRVELVPTPPAPAPQPPADVPDQPAPAPQPPADVPTPPAPAPQPTEAEEKAALLTQLHALGVDPDKRRSVKQLRTILQELTATKAEN
jgi:type IV secretory pathway VirB10-like protein